MQLNHLSLAVPDVAETASFIEKYFGFRKTAVKGDHIIAVLEGEGNFVMVLTRLRAENQAYPADFHFGFMPGSKEAVEQLYKQLVSDAYPVPRPPAKIRNSYAFYFHMPGNIIVEISCNL